jgi:hypothetical protein
MKITFAHICDYATVSREGKLSVMGLFSQINAQTFPAAHALAYVAFQAEVDHEDVAREFTLEIRLVDADGEALFHANAKGQIPPPPNKPRPGEKLHFQEIFAIQNLIFKRPGTYNVNIFLNGALAQQLEFEVLQQTN